VRVDFDLDFGVDFEDKEDMVKSFVLEEFFRDESLVAVNGGFVQIDESHQEFHYFLYIQPVLLVFYH
jgi:hypothetical protein